MSEPIRELLRQRENLQSRVTSAKQLFQSLTSIESNTAQLTGCLGPGRLFIDRHLASDIVATHLEELEDAVAKIDEKVQAIETLLAK